MPASSLRARVASHRRRAATARPPRPAPALAPRPRPSPPARVPAPAPAPASPDAGCAGGPSVRVVHASVGLACAGALRRAPLWHHPPPTQGARGLRVDRRVASALRWRLRRNAYYIAFAPRWARRTVPNRTKRTRAGRDDAYIRRQARVSVGGRRPTSVRSRNWSRGFEDSYLY